LRGSGSTIRSATSAAPSAEAGRPRERLDMTAEEIEALDDPYNQCLATNGWSRRKNPADQAALTKAQIACQSLDPLPPWQLDASNPQAENFVHAVVQCLRAMGVKYVTEEPPEGGAYSFGFGGADNDPTSISLGLQYTPACQKKVAAQGIGN
jgi:hypothetical protein